MPTLEATTETNLADEGSLTILFGGPARTRIIEAFVANESRELNVSDVARLSDTARSSVYRHLEELEEFGLITSVEAGSGKRYTLNSEDALADLLRKVEGVALQRLLEIEQDEN